MNTQLRRVDFEPGGEPAAESSGEGAPDGAGSGRDGDPTTTDPAPEPDQGSQPGGPSS
jgi:hypothetical protein